MLDWPLFDRGRDLFPAVVLRTVGSDNDLRNIFCGGSLAATGFGGTLRLTETGGRGSGSVWTGATVLESLLLLFREDKSLCLAAELETAVCRWRGAGWFWFVREVVGADRSAGGSGEAESLEQCCGMA